MTSNLRDDPAMNQEHLTKVKAWNDLRINFPGICQKIDILEDANPDSERLPLVG